MRYFNSASRLETKKEYDRQYKRRKREAQREVLNRELKPKREEYNRINVIAKILASKV